MSEYNFQQGLRDLAQAGQLSAANEAARNSAKLLEAQKQQAAIEQQKLQLDQIRLQEERARYEAAQNKLERHKAIRNAMAEMERILQSFARDLAAGRLNQIIGGLPLISFLGALTRRQLQMVTACKDELEDLSDIRFMGALQQSFGDLVAAHSGELSNVAIDKAFRKLNELAKWAESIEGKHVALKERTADLLKSLRSSMTDQNTLQKIEANLVQVEKDRQETGEVEAAMRRLWAGVEVDIQKLEAAGVGVAEMELLTDIQAILSFPDFQTEIAEILTKLDESKETLQRSEIQWRRDDSLSKRGMMEVRAGNWGDAERTEGQIIRKDWADFDAGQVGNALCAELKRLREEISRLKSRKERVNLAAIHLQTYAASSFISDPLKKVYDREVSELAASSREARNAVVAVTIVGILAITCYIVSRIAAEKEKVAAAEHAEKERIAAVELAEKERIAAVELAEKERIAAVERAEKERIAAVEAKEQREKALAEGRLLLDETGRSLLLIPEGSFEMGSVDESNAFEHNVYVNAFFIGETEVTYGEWVSVLWWAKVNGYSFSKEGKEVVEKHPVTNVNWYDSVKWCNAKSEKEGLPPCYKVGGAVYRKGEEQTVKCDWKASGYRLPTEAEWEKAARGGLVGKKYPNGDILTNDNANIDGSGTREVKKYTANGYGLYDMAGNVHEWCWDWYEGYYKLGVNDPKGPETGSYRVMRGGDWNFNAKIARSAYRNYGTPSNASVTYGFRLARGRP